MRRDRDRRSLRPVLAVAALLVALLVAVLLAVHLVADGPPRLGLLTRDPAALAGLPWYAGAVSQLTILLWASAATSLLLTARLAPASRRSPALSFGLVALVIGADDAFQLHEGAAGIIPGSEVTVVAAYAVAAPLALLLVWRAYETEVLVPLVGTAALALSSLADLAGVGGAASEDLPKLVGAALWALSGSRLLVREAASADGPTGAPPAPGAGRPPRP